MYLFFENTGTLFSAAKSQKDLLQLSLIGWVFEKSRLENQSWLGAFPSMTKYDVSSWGDQWSWKLMVETSLVLIDHHDIPGEASGTVSSRISGWLGLVWVSPENWMASSVVQSVVVGIKQKNLGKWLVVGSCLLGWWLWWSWRIWVVGHISGKEVIIRITRQNRINLFSLWGPLCRGFVIFVSWLLWLGEFMSLERQQAQS